MKSSTVEEPETSRSGKSSSTSAEHSKGSTQKDNRSANRKAPDLIDWLLKSGPIALSLTALGAAGASKTPSVQKKPSKIK